LQFSLQAASPETSGYTLINGAHSITAFSFNYIIYEIKEQTGGQDGATFGATERGTVSFKDINNGTPPTEQCPYVHIHY
jgi:hypothetical protein